ncbi:uncharacterized protein N7459_006116 [Penicillium hispanicum]|uniref:uncharacterized protein n=1 Tax=Penicillium hispanicum TaxID=1080232 RepID=UPI002540A087|nr:uncharacterized protein N7459_006116 [Penicillium hispanicum]KAJ5580131.1 hypothetical protein N7459_006116 [Penicillium hispanicum]
MRKQLISLDLEDVPCETFTQSDLARLGAHLSRFDPYDASFLESKDFFFRPLPVEEFNAYSLNWKKVPEYNRRVLELADIELPEQQPRGFEQKNASARARQMFTYLDTIQSYLERKNPRGHLSDVSGWYDFCCDYPFFEEDESSGLLDGCNTKGHASWHYVSLSEWQTDDQEMPDPHLRIVMISNTVGKDDELLIGELGGLVQAICTRMHHKDFQDVSVVPVLMISLFGPRHGRIIQVNFDESETLRIRATKIFNFLRPAEAPFDLFLRFYVSEPRREMGLEFSGDPGTPEPTNVPVSEPRREADLKLYADPGTPKDVSQSRPQTPGPGKENMGPRVDYE